MVNSATLMPRHMNFRIEITLRGRTLLLKGTASIQVAPPLRKIVEGPQLSDIPYSIQPKILRKSVCWLRPGIWHSFFGQMFLVGPMDMNHVYGLDLGPQYSMFPESYVHPLHDLTVLNIDGRQPVALSEVFRVTGS